MLWKLSLHPAYIVMGFCTSRHLLLSIIILQIVTLSVRQVFDFLGFMWGSVLANFVYTLCIIFGTFGVVQCRLKYIIAYTVSSSVWLLWNVFVICFYMNLISLNQKNDLLSLYTGSTSWWEINGPGCKALFLANKSTTDDPSQPIKPDMVTNCIVEYYNVEIIQASIQAILAIWACIMGIKVSHVFLVRDESVSETGSKNQNSLPLYSIEYSSKRYDDDEDDDDDTSRSTTEEVENNHQGNARRPMTPRRVKRRSVNSRGTLPPASAHNPHVLIRHPQYLDQPPPPYVRRQSCGGNARYSTRSLPRRHHRTSSNQSLDQRSSTFGSQVINDSSTSNDSCRLPAYSSHSQLLSPSDLLQHRPVPGAALSIGHTNPSYASNISLERPPSARSSYSNYHGVRALSYTNNQATPQVPINNYRRSVRGSHSTFLDYGPPAYEVQGCVNSETVI